MANTLWRAVILQACTVIVAALVFPESATAQVSGLEAVDVRAVTDEADAVLMILEKKKAGQAAGDNDWQRLFSTEGYTRLKKRETAFKIKVDDADFKKFVLSDELAARGDALRITLENWKRADLTAAGRRALAYLPAGTRIQAKIFPVLKPRTNSFVFELKTDPAIFLSVKPAVNAAQFQNTVAHELHHVGYASACDAKEEARLAKLPPNVKSAAEWIGAFGEGFAMLAAAGGPDVHPHAVSPADERARWDRDMAKFDQDLHTVERFLLDVLEGRLKTPEEIEDKASTFFGVQGPWYTVGWKMAVTIEKTYGRAKLIECMCDSVALLRTYNAAAEERNHRGGERLAMWSPELLGKLGTASDSAVRE